MAKGPNTVFDVQIGETWWMLTTAERDAVIDWMERQGIDVKRQVRLEVYDGYAISTQIVLPPTDGLRDLEKDGLQFMTTRYEITEQPPQRLDGR